MRHVGEKVGFIFRCQRQFGRLLFERATSLLDLLVLTFDFHIAFGELLSLLFQLFIGLLKFRLPYLQLGGQLLRLFQQALRLHRGLNAVQHYADTGRELIEEGHLQVRECVDRSNFDHRPDLLLEQHGKHNDVLRRRLEKAGADRHDIRRHVGDQQPFCIRSALPD